MARYIQEMANNRPQKPTQSSKKEKPRELPKPGQYRSEDLYGTKKIYSKTGGKY